ncbi:MAG: hypothetical protein K5762_03540 [Bacilli bacterium]|nr:hypothetical protein [Bacilli bacterium]
MKKNLKVISISLLLPALLVSCTKEGSIKAEVTSYDVSSTFMKANTEKAGRIESLTYTTKDYILDSGKSEEKKLNVYLPYNYDESKQYNILYLLHGTDKQDVDHINTWFDRIEIKNVLDNLIAYEQIDPLLVVCPTFYSYGLYGDDNVTDIKEATPVKTNSSNNFTYELRNDIIPAVESKYATYASEISEAGLKASRDHRAMAGLSNGARITLNSGIIHNFDYLSTFGIYSSSWDASEIISALNSQAYQDLSLNGFYNASGIYDFAYNKQKKMYDELLKSDKFTTDNSKYFNITFGYHSARSWRVGLYDSLLYMFGGNQA